MGTTRWLWISVLTWTHTPYQRLRTYIWNWDREESYQDDMLITGSSDTEHLDSLDRVLKKLSTSSFQVRLDKCKFMAQSVSWLIWKVYIPLRTKYKSEMHLYPIMWQNWKPSWDCSSFMLGMFPTLRISWVPYTTCCKKVSPGDWNQIILQHFSRWRSHYRRIMS